MHDPVKKPYHYTWHPEIECKDIIKYFDWPLGSAIKYIFRCNHAGNREQDIKKAIECCKIALTSFPSAEENTTNERKPEEM